MSDLRGFTRDLMRQMEFDINTADHWKVSKDIIERGQAYDLSQGGDGLKVRTLSAISVD